MLNVAESYLKQGACQESARSTETTRKHPVKTMTSITSDRQTRMLESRQSRRLSTCLHTGTHDRDHSRDEVRRTVQVSGPTCAYASSQRATHCHAPSNGLSHLSDLRARVNFAHQMKTRSNTMLEHTVSVGVESCPSERKQIETRNNSRASHVSFNGTPSSYDLATIAQLDREELRDQMEWDIGVAEELFKIKSGQMQAQLAIENRQIRQSQDELEQARYQEMKASGGRFALLCDWLTSHILQSRHASTKNSNADIRSSFDALPSAAGWALLTSKDLPDSRTGLASITRSSCVGRSSLAARPGHGGLRASIALRRRTHVGVPKLTKCFGLNKDGLVEGIVDEKTLHQMRSRSQRALFEGLAHTAQMSKDRWYIVREHSPFRTLWRHLLEMAVLTTAVLSPLIASEVLLPNSTFDVVEMICDCLFVIDTLLNFFTAYRDDLCDIIVTAPLYIRQKYMKGMFFVDLVAAFPLDRIVKLVLASSDSDRDVHRTASQKRDYSYAFRLLKLVRMYRWMGFQYDNSSEYGDMTISPTLRSLAKVVGLLFFIWHWVACVYSLMSARVHDVPDRSDRLGREGDIILFNTTDPWIAPRHIVMGGSGLRYLHALAWAVRVTCSTTSPDPNTFEQLVFTIVITILGVSVLASMIGVATATVSEMHSQRSETAHRLQHLARYMQRKHLPMQIRRRVLAYYKFQQASTHAFEEEGVLNGLPRSMRMQIAIQTHRDVFVQLPLFWLCQPEELLLIVGRLRPALISPGEMLDKEGCIGAGLYLLMKGAVETTRNGELLVVLLATAAFGEASLRLEVQVSDVTVRALRFCEVSVLAREDFLEIVQLNQNIELWLDIYISERDRRLKDPCVQQQSKQTKSATIRCGGDFKDFSELHKLATTDARKLKGVRAKVPTSILSVVCALSMTRAVRKKKHTAVSTLAQDKKKAPGVPIEVAHSCSTFELAGVQNGCQKKAVQSGTGLLTV